MTWVIVAAVALIGIILIVRVRASLLRKALARERKEAGLPEPTDRFEIIPKGDKKVAYRCGHEGPKQYVGHFYGEEMEPSPEILKTREKCPDCQMTEMRPLIIRCAQCGLPIFPGAPVALYAGPAAAFTKAWSTMHEGQYVGCLRWDCCPSGGFFAGHWTGTTVHSAFGGAGSAAAAAMASGGMVVVGDVDDPSSISVTSLQDQGSEKKE